MRKKKSAKARSSTARQALDIPEMVRRDVPHIEMQGNREVNSFLSDQIKINAGVCVIRFSGGDLTIRAYSENQTEINGEILQIDFEN